MHFCIDFYDYLPFGGIRITTDSDGLCSQIGSQFHLQTNLCVYYSQCCLKYQMIYCCQYLCLFSSVGFKIHWTYYFLMILFGTSPLASELVEKYFFVELIENYFKSIEIIIDSFINLSALFDSSCSVNNYSATDYSSGFFLI